MPYVVIAGLLLSMIFGAGGWFLGESYANAQCTAKTQTENAQQATAAAKSDTANRVVEQQSGAAAAQMESNYGTQSVRIVKQAAVIQASIPSVADVLAGELVHNYTGCPSSAASVPANPSPSSAAPASAVSRLSSQIARDLAGLNDIATAAGDATNRNVVAKQFAEEVQRVNQLNAAAAARRGTGSK